MSIEFFKEQFDRVQSANGSSRLNTVRQNAFSAFNKMGVPTVKNEEWKYTRISGLFNKEYQFPFTQIATLVTEADVNAVRLPGYEQAHELVFINGVFSFPLSKILRSEGLTVQPLEEAAGNEYAAIVAEHLGHSSRYLTDGINALNTAFVYGGVFITIKKGYSSEHPVYIYNITDSRSGNILSQPRSLVHINERAEVQLVETFVTLGLQESFTNQVVEIVLEKEARLEYYKIQNDARHTNQVSTTHIRQVGKSFVHTVTISLNGNIVRNNLNIILEAAHCESHLYGLYLQKGNSHIDNHTLVDNAQPNCISNELYKGIMDENATGVFNGKILVQQLAQKTNAYQSNKNILLSASASVNAKPQLEIFADDVKCSHGCTVGSLDEEAMFYLRSRGVTENSARSLLLHAYADDILGMIKPVGIRTHIEQLINERLEISEV